MRLSSLFLFFVLSALGSYAQGTAGTPWSLKAPMPQASFFENAAVSINGKAYVVTSQSVLEYDPLADKWAEYKAEFSPPRHDFETVVLHGKLYVIGGCAGGSLHIPTGAVDEFDPVTHVWRSRAPLPTPRMAVGAAASGGRIYAIGGINPTAPVSAVEVYDPTTDTWTKKRNWSKANTNAVAVELSPGKIHVLVASPTRGALEEYDTASDTFRVLPNPLTPRHCAAVAVVAGRLVTVGGHVGETQALPTIEAYDPVKNTWIALAGLPEARSCPAGIALDGKLFVIGGSAPLPWKNRLSSMIAVEEAELEPRP